MEKKVNNLQLKLKHNILMLKKNMPKTPTKTKNIKISGGCKLKKYLEQNFENYSNSSVKLIKCIYLKLNNIKKEFQENLKAKKPLLK